MSRIGGRPANLGIGSAPRSIFQRQSASACSAFCLISSSAIAGTAHPDHPAKFRPAFKNASDPDNMLLVGTVAGEHIRQPTPLAAMARAPLGMDAVTGLISKFGRWHVPGRSRASVPLSSRFALLRSRNGERTIPFPECDILDRHLPRRQWASSPRASHRPRRPFSRSDIQSVLCSLGPPGSCPDPHQRPLGNCRRPMNAVFQEFFLQKLTRNAPPIKAGPGSKKIMSPNIKNRACIVCCLFVYIQQ
jgi:hypothetical protein